MFRKWYSMGKVVNFDHFVFIDRKKDQKKEEENVQESTHNRTSYNNPAKIKDMPTISVHEEDLENKLGEKISEEKLIDICFDFGLEIDEVEIKNGKKIYKIEVPANRYDLVCVEGLCRALKNFMGNFEKIEYEIKMNSKDACLKEDHIVNVHESVDDKRGYIVSCILKNVYINEQVYNNIIELQEKLHHNIGKKRQVLAIGIHDYDKIKFPVQYKFEDKSKINFIPLNESTILNGCNLLKYYEDNSNLKPYLKILKNYDMYPILIDVKNNILSLPPIINCDYTKITLKTKNLFVECTAIDKYKAEIALNIICSMLSQYCNPPYSIHSVLVSYDKNHLLEKGNYYLYPSFRNKTLRCNMKYVKTLSGISNITIDDVQMLLKRMMLNVTINDTENFTVDIPFYRSDIMHCCDIVEDIAIAYGYGNIMNSEEIAISKKHLLNTCTDLFRNALVECTYIEVMTNALLSKKENYIYMLRHFKNYENVNINLNEYNPLAPPIQIMNSKTSEYEILRTSLIVNLLKFVSANKHRELPLRFFEIGDVSYAAQNKTDTNAINKRYLSVIFADKFTAGFEELHGLLEIVLREFQLFNDYKIEEKKKENVSVRSDVFYKLIPREVDIVLFPHRLKFGILGIIHPTVLKNFSIDIPVSVFEVNVETLLNVLMIFAVNSDNTSSKWGGTSYESKLSFSNFLNAKKEVMCLIGEKNRLREFPHASIPMHCMRLFQRLTVYGCEYGYAGEMLNTQKVGSRPKFSSTSHCGSAGVYALPVFTHSGHPHKYGLFITC
ncbi:phenylalanine--tRNA ligase beta subunit, putative [Plasmodium ovale curtisi]|uniref:Phenylalanine--tRNA ligase beta subunit n=1 Tax=Plasmodium ovale curtisi TaxID=864141 RepID=A0A1A8VWQ2_PLAOA|nr:phenylalanine--tRNA ligase beta subunit, putative [Plasmodium ovale curtisi]